MSPTLSDSTRSIWLVACALVAAIFAAYWDSWHVPMLLDDESTIIRNPTVANLHHAWRPPSSVGLTSSGRPVVNITLALNYHFAGEAVLPYHVTNVVVHALAALVLLALVRSSLFLLRSRELFVVANPTWVAGLTAALWALHPVQTESVVYIVQRAESLAGLFILLAMYCLCRHASRGGRGWLISSWVACLVGMGTKEICAAIPVLVYLYDRTFIAGTFADAWRQRRGFYLALAATWILLGFLVWSGHGRAGTVGLGGGIRWDEYLQTQAWAIVHYLRLSLWPVGLVFDYGIYVEEDWAVIASCGTVVVAVLATTLFALRRWPVVGFLGVSFFAILGPTSSVIPVLTQTVAEHRMYLPLASVLIALISIPIRRFGMQACWGLLCGVIACFVLTHLRVQDYRDAIAIWSDTVAKMPGNARALNNLAWALQRAGRSDEADRYFARAVELQPNYVAARYNWGVALLDRGQVAEAIAQFESAVRLDPKNADAHVNLGNAFMQVARTGEALRCYEVALSLSPAADVHYNIGVALIEVGQSRPAIEHLQRYLDYNTRSSEAHYQVARAFEQAGDLRSAEQSLAQVVRLAPEHEGAHRRLGMISARAGRMDEAAAHFEALVRLAPTDADAKANLGNVRLFQGRTSEAIRLYEETLLLRPNDNVTRENLRVAREARP